MAAVVMYACESIGNVFPGSTFLDVMGGGGGRALMVRDHVSRTRMHAHAQSRKRAYITRADWDAHIIFYHRLYPPIKAIYLAVRSPVVIGVYRHVCWGG